MCATSKYLEVCIPQRAHTLFFLLHLKATHTLKSANFIAVCISVRFAARTLNSEFHFNEASKREHDEVQSINTILQTTQCFAHYKLLTKLKGSNLGDTI